MAERYVSYADDVGCSGLKKKKKTHLSLPFARFPSFPGEVGFKESFFSLPSVLSCIFSSFLLLVFFADRGMLLAGLV